MAVASVLKAAACDAPIMHDDCAAVLQQLERGVLTHMLSQQAPAVHCSQPPNMGAERRCKAVRTVQHVSDAVHQSQVVVIQALFM